MKKDNDENTGLDGQESKTNKYEWIKEKTHIAREKVSSQADLIDEMDLDPDLDETHPEVVLFNEMEKELISFEMEYSDARRQTGEDAYQSGIKSDKETAKYEDALKILEAKRLTMIKEIQEARPMAEEIDPLVVVNLRKIDGVRPQRRW